MQPQFALGTWLGLCAAGVLLSAKSAVVVRRGAPWTFAGWLLTVAYFLMAGGFAAARERAPLHVDWVCVGALTVAFAVAGIRDEPQAEPWWWPSRVGTTGRERRARRGS